MFGMKIMGNGMREGLVVFGFAVWVYNWFYVFINNPSILFHMLEVNICAVWRLSYRKVCSVCATV